MKRIGITVLALICAGLFHTPVASAQTGLDAAQLLELGNRIGASGGRLMYTRAGSYYGDKPLISFIISIKFNAKH